MVWRNIGLGLLTNCNVYIVLTTTMKFFAQQQLHSTALRVKYVSLDIRVRIQGREQLKYVWMATGEQSAAMGGIVEMRQLFVHLLDSLL